uniref:RRM domain-containing protein n=1 Tax=Parastrongyloides trichosuri TaxID=131310 RepID=A0A0N4ZII4_PARTI
MMFDDDEEEFTNFYRPKGLMKTLHRVNAQNLESGGLNNFTEAFQSFMTRAKFFSVGRLRRTMSSSALEFMKYRTLLPMIVGNECDNGSSFDDFNPNSYKNNKSFDKNEDKSKVIVTNIPIKVSTTQCKSFFSKYGKIISCELSFENKPINSDGKTMKNTPKIYSTAVITFSSKDDADKLLRVDPNDLKLYGQIMQVDKIDYSLKKSLSNVKCSNKSGLSFFGESSSSDGGIINRYSRTSSTSSLSSLSISTDKIVSWDTIPNRALELIMSYISHVDCIRMESVNKKWLESGIKAWTKTTVLNLKNAKKIGKKFTNEKPLTINYLKNFLQRCGINLRKLDLTSVPNTLDEKTFIIIGNYCKKLESLDISGIRGTVKNFVFLGECLSLKHIAYRNMNDIDEKCFWYLIKGFADTLISVDFSGCKYLTGRCFISLTDSLKELYLDGCYLIESKTIEDICMQAHGLKILKINGCFKITDECLSLVSRTLLDLEIFSLNGNGYKNLISSSICCLTNLENLVDLSFDYNSLINDTFIEALCKSGNKLKKLSLAYSGDDNSISSNGLVMIKELKELTYLDLSGLTAVDSNSLSEIIKNCQQISYYYLRNCPNLDDDALECFVNVSDEITKIDVSACLAISNKSIQALLKNFTYDEDNFNAIILVIGSTPYNIDGLRTRNSRVALDFNDTSSLPEDITVNPSYSEFEEIVQKLNGDVQESNSDEISQEDDFNIMNVKNSYIVGALTSKEESPIFDSHEEMLEWAKKEAAHLNIKI